jgi:hypothetical protein
VTYAASTTVSAEQSRVQIERLVAKAGASHFASGWGNASFSIMFEMRDRRVRFTLPLPQRSKSARQRVRSVIKAKLESVESGVTTFEQEFLAHIILPGGETVGEFVIPQIAEAYASGVAMPPMLGAGSS